MPTVEQIRAARALLGWNQHELADRAGLSQTGIARIENGTNQPNSKTIQKIEEAFDHANIEFIDGGVRVHNDRLVVLSGNDSFRKLQDDVFHTLESSGGEVLLLGIDEIKPNEKENYEYTKMHIDRLQKAGISEKILISENESEFLAPKEWYRTIKQNYFSPNTVFVYDTKVALGLRDPKNKILILDNKHYAETLKAFFHFIWDNAKPVE